MKNFHAVLLLPLIMAAPAAAQGEPQLSITLNEAIRQVVEKNLDVKAELYNPAAAEADLQKNRGIYDTHLTLDTSYQDSTSVPTSPAAANKLKVFKLSPGAYRLFPTGGTVTADFNNTYTDTNSSFANYRSYWQSDLTFTLSQPLLKNFGREATELNISIATYSKEGTFEQFKTVLTNTVAQARTAYYALFSARESLDAKKTSLELARKILEDTKGRVKAGVLPAMEILNAEYGVALREKELIDAERAVKDQEDALRLLMQLKGNTEIVPVEAPPTEKFQASETDEITSALINRNDLRQAQVNLRSAEMQAKVARHQTLPDLSLNTSVAVTGLGENYGRNMERVGSTDYPVWFVGLQLDYPLGNSTAENDYIRKKIAAEQSRTQLQSLEESIAKDVRSALRGIETSYKQLDVTSRQRSYAEEVLQAFQKKQQVGLATTKDVLDELNNLVAAKNDQINARVNYANAITQLWQVTGQLLDKQGVRLTGTEAEDVYRKSRENN